MKNFYILVLFFLFSSATQAQRLYQHPSLSFLGTDINSMADTRSGLMAYDGLGKLYLLQNNLYLQNRAVNLSWVPVNSFSNGFGMISLPTYESGIQLLASPGNYASAIGKSMDWGRLRQVVHAQGQWRTRKTDHNKDGFSDQLQAYSYLIQQNLLTTHRDWLLSTQLSYVKSAEHGGQLAYKWPQDQGSDEIYGFGNDTRQWIATANAERKLGAASNLQIRVNARQHKENGWYGQRPLSAQETTGGILGVYTHKKILHQSKAILQFQKQSLSQSWARWKDDRNWNQAKLGLHHQRFLSGNWLLKAALQFDYHNELNWQLLPNLKLDYLGIKKLKIGLFGGRDYRFARLTDEFAAYRISQRRWQQDSYGADRLWHAGLSAQSEAYHIGEVKQLFKVTFLNRFYEQLMVIDPSEAGTVSAYLFSEDIPQQQLLITTLQTSYRHFRSSVAYRFSNKQLPLASGRNQQIFDARHSLLASLAYSRRDNTWNTLKWSARLSYLWQSPQVLPNQGESLHLHDLRLHVNYNWRIKKGARSSRFLGSFIGVENLMNQRQQDIYEGEGAPFDASFDGSSAWGSPVGIQFYAGLKWNL